MSEDDLKSMGVLLPEEKWGERELVSTLNKPLLIFLFITVIVSSILMYTGNGGWLTWAGTSVFILTLILFTVHTLRSINRQEDVIERTTDTERSGDKSS